MDDFLEAHTVSGLAVPREPLAYLLLVEEEQALNRGDALERLEPG